jgi:6,7-dimethyl-8-ribityllumazine synthase
MHNLIEGNLSASGFKFGIIAPRFNGFINEKLIGGSLDYLIRSGVKESDITVVRVPGAFEISTTAKIMAESKKYDGLICLGTLIRGETTHFDLLSNQVAKMIAELSAAFSIPIGYGIITSESIEQAISRAGSKMGNKGFEAAMAVVEMVTLFSKLKN